MTLYGRRTNLSAEGERLLYPCIPNVQSNNLKVSLGSEVVVWPTEKPGSKNRGQIPVITNIRRNWDLTPVIESDRTHRCQPIKTRFSNT
jgi:hypothetical protein